MRSEEEKGKRLAEKYGILMTKEMEVDRMCDLSQIFIDKGMGKRTSVRGKQRQGRKQCGLRAIVVETPVDPL